MSASTDEAVVLSGADLESAREVALEGVLWFTEAMHGSMFEGWWIDAVIRRQGVLNALGRPGWPLSYPCRGLDDEKRAVLAECAREVLDLVTDMDKDHGDDEPALRVLYRRRAANAERVLSIMAPSS